MARRFFQVFRRDAGSGIGKRDGDKFAFHRAARLGGRDGFDDLNPHGQGSPRTHGIARIDRQVHQGRVELAWVGVDQAFLIRHVDVDLDPGAGEAADHLGNRARILPGVEHFRLQGLPAGERE